MSSAPSLVTVFKNLSLVVKELRDLQQDLSVKEKEQEEEEEEETSSDLFVHRFVRVRREEKRGALLLSSLI